MSDVGFASAEARASAAQPTPSGAAATSNEIVSFAIGDDHYGVDIMAVREIRGWTEATHLPRQPDFVRGVLNLRGSVVPIVDLRCRFGQGLTEATPLHIIIIVQIGARQVGLLADRVLDIVSFDRANIQPVPQVAERSQAQFLAGIVTIDDGMLTLIDLANLLALRDGEAAVLAA